MFLCHGIALKNDGSNTLEVQRVNFLGHKYLLEKSLHKVCDRGSVNIISSTGGYDWQSHVSECMEVINAESRIYATGFSMGGMMTHAITAAYPEIFSAGVPCNAFAFNRYKTPEDALKFFLRGVDVGTVSYSAQLADFKRKEHPEYRMPIFQNAGMVDRDIGFWPVDGNLEDVLGKTIRFWKEYNHISTEKELDGTTLTGLAADETTYLDENQRYVP